MDTPCAKMHKEKRILPCRNGTSLEICRFWGF